MKNSKTKKIVLIGMLCAVAYVVTLLSKLIPISVAGFLTFDMKDAIVALCGFMLGPVPALVVAIIPSFIEMLTISTTGPIGLLMNVLSTCAFVLPAAFFYMHRKKFSGAVAGLVIGIACMTGVMLLWNWIITPIYMGVPRDTVVAMLVPVFLPFNLIKGAINATIAILIYKPVVKALRKARMLPESKNEIGEPKKISLGVTIIAAFVLVTLVVAVLIWTKVI